MCVIASKPANIEIPRETLQRCFDANPDGAGFVAAASDGLHMSKGFFTFDAFWEAYERFSICPAVIHFRIRTHGNKDAEMCHPFKVTDNLWVAHNGVINIDTKSDNTKSDTWHFVDKVLIPELGEGAESHLDNPSFQYLLSCSIGSSKLAFLHKDGSRVIINADKGEFDGKVWYSNQSYKRVRPAGFSADPRHSTGGYGSYGSYCGTDYEDYGSRYAGRSVRKTKVLDIPAHEQWAVDTLREFGFSDEDILDEHNDDNLTEMALDLLVYEAGEREAGVETPRSEMLAGNQPPEDDSTLHASDEEAAAALADEVAKEAARQQELHGIVTSAAS